MAPKLPSPGRGDRGGGQPGGRAFASLAFQRQVWDVPDPPNPEGVADWIKSAALSGLGILGSRSPGVETPGWAKPALWAVPLPRNQRCVSRDVYKRPHGPGKFLAPLR